MPCNHKFINELDLERIDFEPSTLIVGTFIPEWPGNAGSEWFYGPANDTGGRRATNFWDVLPKIYAEPGLMNAGPAEWKTFCKQKQIAITGLIKTIEDADRDNTEHIKILASGDDKAIVYHFDDFIFTDIPALLRKHPGIRNVYFTRGITEAFWRYAWNPVMQYCAVHDIHERRLLSPSVSALYQHEAYNKENPDKTIPSLEDYILMRWQEEWH